MRIVTAITMISTVNTPTTPPIMVTVLLEPELAGALGPTGTAEKKKKKKKKKEEISGYSYMLECSVPVIL